jgi:hypothetical protein
MPALPPEHIGRILDRCLGRLILAPLGTQDVPRPVEHGLPHELGDVADPGLLPGRVDQGVFRRVDRPADDTLTGFVWLLFGVVSHTLWG